MDVTNGLSPNDAARLAKALVTTADPTCGPTLPQVNTALRNLWARAA